MEPLFAVVATTGYLLLVEVHSRKVIPLENDRTEYYGISWFPGGKDFVLSHSGLDNVKLKDIQTYATSEVGFLSHGNFHSETFLSEPHQLLCASDGRVVCTNTGRNAITVFDLEKPGHFQEKRLSNVRWDRLSLEEITGDHLNSVFEKDGHLYVIAHGHHNGSLMAVLTYPALEMVSVKPIERRTGLHNVWVSDEGQKIACHSNIGALIDLESNEVLWESGSPIYTRGLAVSSDIMLVGESQMTGRDLRRSSMSGLWILERGTYRALDYICLGPYGAVNEVRLLNVKDYAHHGHTFPFVSELFERSLFNRKSEERLAACQRSKNIQQEWAGVELVYGVPKTLEDGGKEAILGNLCLIKKTEDVSQAQRSLAFSYSLDTPSTDSHVAVVTYQGSGGDTDMNALLIQPINDVEAGLVLWTNDGAHWNPEPDVQVTGLPHRGDVRVVASEAGLEFYLNDEWRLTVDAARLPFLEGSLGIRWIGSTISRFIE